MFTNEENLMPKLHEILAVESGLQTTAKQTNEETIRTFGKRDEHFVGTVTELKHFAEDDKKLDVTEAKEMVTTVFDKLMYNVGPNVRAIDAYLQKEATNQKAHADIVVGDATLAIEVPATVLRGPTIVISPRDFVRTSSAMRSIR